MDYPTFVRIEYWNQMTASWEVGHNGINLMNPAVYVQKLSKRGVLARAVEPASGQVVYAEGADLL